MATWGVVTTAGAGSYGLSNRADAGIGQFNVSGQKLDSISAYTASAAAVSVRAALFVSDINDAEGATLVEDLGVQSCSGNPGWTTWTSTSTPALTSGKYYVIAFKTNDAGANLQYRGSISEDLTNMYRWTDAELTGGGTDETVAWSLDSPLPNQSFLQAWEPVCYITYSAAASGSIAILRRRGR